MSHTDRQRGLDPRTASYFAETLNSAADAARTVIVPLFRRIESVDNKSKKSGYDPVTIADREAEKVIRALIKERHPDHGILGEEFGIEEGQSPYTWVIDPIDGTRAFIAGVPVWGTLIALNDGGRPLMGVIDQGFTQERFLGLPGLTIYARGGDTQIARTRDTQNLSDAVLATTDPRLFRDGREQDALQALDSAVMLTRFGLDCYAYAMIACGHIDLVIENRLAPYDIQGPIAVIENAGGVVTDWSGGPAHDGGEVLAAANPELHAQALKILTPFIEASSV